MDNILAELYRKKLENNMNNPLNITTPEISNTDYLKKQQNTSIIPTQPLDIVHTTSNISDYMKPMNQTQPDIQTQPQDIDTEKLKQEYLKSLVKPSEAVQNPASLGNVATNIKKGKGFLGKLGGGLAGLINYAGSSQGMKILAGLQDNPYAAQGYLQEAQGKQTAEQALQQQTSEQEKERMKNIGTYLSLKGNELTDIPILNVDPKKNIKQIGTFKAPLGTKPEIKYEAAEKPSIEEQLALYEAKQKLKNDAKKNMPASKATEIGDVKSSIEMLDSLANSASKIKHLTFTPLDKLKAMNPWDTGAQSFNQMVASVKQVIGKGLEGGVLRKEDESKYEKIIPKVGDTKEVLQNKYAQLRLLLLNKHKNMIESLDEAGYNTDKFNYKFKDESNIFPEKEKKIGKYKIVGIE